MCPYKHLNTEYFLLKDQTRAVSHSCARHGKIVFGQESFYQQGMLCYENVHGTFGVLFFTYRIQKI